MALGSTQPLTEMSTRNISWGIKAAGAWSWQPSNLRVPIALKSESLNLLEPSRPVLACNWIALPCSLKDNSNCVCIFDIPSVFICRRLFAAGRRTATHVLLQVLQVDTQIIATFGQTGYCTMFEHLEEHVADSAEFRSSCRPAGVMNGSVCQLREI